MHMLPQLKNSDLDTLISVYKELKTSSPEECHILSEYVIGNFNLGEILSSLLNIKKQLPEIPNAISLIAQKLTELEWALQSGSLSHKDFTENEDILLIFMKQMTDCHVLFFLFQSIQEVRLPFSDKFKEEIEEISLKLAKKTNKNVKNQSLDDLVGTMLKDSGESETANFLLANLSRIDLNKRFDACLGILSNTNDSINEVVSLLLTNNTICLPCAKAITHACQINHIAITPKLLYRILLARSLLKRESIEYNAVDTLFKNIKKSSNAACFDSNYSIKSIKASALDGAGACGIALHYTKHKSHHMAGIILKLNVGLKDAWTTPPLDSNEAKAHLSEINQAYQMPMRSIGFDQLKYFLEIGLSIAHEEGQPLDFDTVLIFEDLNLFQITPRPIDLEKDIDSLKNKISSYLTIDEQFKKESLSRVKSWHSIKPELVGNWFDYDQEMIKLVEGNQSDLEKYNLFENYFLNYRSEFWAKLFYLTARVYSDSPKKGEETAADLLLLSKTMLHPDERKQHPFVQKIIRESYVASAHQASKQY